MMNSPIKHTSILTALLLTCSIGSAQLVIPDSATVELNPLLSLFKIERAENSEFQLTLPSNRPLSLFCRLEHDEDSKGYVKKRFRLGTLDYTKYLEGKNQTYILD